MKPSDFRKHPLDSILQNTESEIVARNIMVILARTGDEFRLMEWDEYFAKEKQTDFISEWNRDISRWFGVTACRKRRHGSSVPTGNLSNYGHGRTR